MKKVFLGFAAMAVVFLSQSALASPFTTNPLWTAPSSGLNLDSADLTTSGNPSATVGYNVFAYEFTLTSNITVDELGTYVGGNSASTPDVSPLAAYTDKNKSGKTLWTNPGAAETVQLYKATTWNAAGTKVTGWTAIGPQVSISSTDTDVYDDVAWGAIPNQTLSDATVACGSGKTATTCTEVYAVELDTNGDFIYSTTVTNNGPQSVANGVEIVLNGNHSSDNASFALASYRDNDNGVGPGPLETPNNLGAATEFDYYGPFVGETPEPGSLVLLGSGFGLVGLFVFLRHRRGTSPHTIA
jgi:hypothetical protein